MSGMNNGVKSSTGYSVNLIGAGGIASWVLHGLVRPARRFAQANGTSMTIRVYDSDIVDEFFEPAALRSAFGRVFSRGP